MFWEFERAQIFQGHFEIHFNVENKFEIVYTIYI